MKASILVLEDDRVMAEVILDALKGADYEVSHAADADAAFKALKSGKFDLMISDVQMPGISGMKLLEIIKQDAQFAELPVIMLTVQGGDDHKVQGLKAGADDYMTKPFSSKELLARVEALLRRVNRSGKTGSVLEFRGVRLDLDQRRLWVSDESRALTPAEFDILSVMLRRPGFVFTYGNLIDSLSGGNKEMTSGSLYFHIKNLRKKMGASGDLIETVYGVGYRIKND